MRETENLTKNLTSLSYSHLAPETVTMSKACILDYLCAAIVGATADSGRIAAGMVSAFAPSGKASIIGGGGLRVDPGYASLANGISGHALEIDDYFMMNHIAGHLGSVVVPPALALAEQFEKTPRDVLTAVVAGYDVAARVSLAVGPGHYWRGFHSTGTIGTFGAAASAISVLGLKDAQALSTIGLAATQAAGLHGANRSHAKALHAGRAGQNGVQAALLARDGYVGPDDIIEGKQGFAEVESDAFYPNYLTENWGSPYLIHNNSFKPFFTACFDVADGMLDLIKTHNLKPEDVEKVEVFTTKDFARNQRGLEFKSVNHAKISVEFCVAVCLADRACGLDQYTEKRIRLQDPVINDLMKRVTASPDDDIIKRVHDGHYACRIHVTRKSGAPIVHLVEDTKGYYRNPVSIEFIRDKFYKTCANSISKANADRVVNYVMEMEKQTALESLAEPLRAKL